MSEEVIHSTPDEALFELIQTNAEIISKGELEQRLNALDNLTKELKQSTSSMTSVPKPMKHLIPYIEEFSKAFNTFTNQEFRIRLANILSLLSIINIETSFDILIYRLYSPIGDIGTWGHEYVRCLTLSIMNAYQNKELLPYNLSFDDLVSQISKYYIEHNDEPDAVDLLLKLDRQEEIVDLVDETNHKRVCIYLSQCFSYLSEPLNFQVLNLLVKIYLKLNKTAQAFINALKLNDFELFHEIFVNCNDYSVKKQLAFLLARRLVVFNEEMDEELTNIATNSNLFNFYRSIAQKLGKDKPNTPDKVLQFQASTNPKQASKRGDSPFSLMSKSFVGAFHNAAIQEDLYYTAQRGEDSLMRNRDNGLAAAVASLGFLYLWDVENGPNKIDRWINSSDSYLRMGGLAATGLLSSAVRSEFDPALAILSDFLDSPNSLHSLVGAIFGIAMAYAGSARKDVISHLTPHFEHSDPRISSYAHMAVGLIYVGTANQEAIQILTGLLTVFTDSPNNIRFLPFFALGASLVFLGRQSACSLILQVLEAETNEQCQFIRCVIESLSYAGTGNVELIQRLLRILTGENSLEHAASVIGIAVVALGDPIGCQMSKRMFDHILQYGKPFARRMVPIAVALTSVSFPQPETIDMLHRIGHDSDQDVAINAALALGILGAGTQNSKIIGILKALEGFHSENPQIVMIIQISIGLCHLGQGLMSLSPTYDDNGTINPVALGSLLVLAFAAIQTKDILTQQDPLLLYFVAPAISPRFLATLNEDLEIIPIQVRVGTAIDVVGQAGKPKAITGFQTLETPVILAAGQRAEFVDDAYEPLSPILEGFVIVRKKA